MPSQYRYHGESAGTLASVQMQSQFSPYAMPCTPQAHCRLYEPAQVSYHGPTQALSFHDMTESWMIPATTGSLETITRNGSPQEFYNFQQPSELPMGSADDGVGTSALTEIRSETTRWSPPKSSFARAVPTDIVTSLHGPGSSVDVKPSVNGSNNMVSSPWISREAPNPVTVATAVDLNAPITSDGAGARVTPAQALVVRKAPRPSSSAGALQGAPKGAKTKATGKGVRGKTKSISAPASPSELRRSNSKSLSVQKSKKPKPDAMRVSSQRENHIWSERERRKGMNYLFNTLRSLLPHPVDKTDKSTVVGEIIKYIQSLQVKLEVMTTKQQVMMATRSGFHSSTTTLQPKVLVSNGLTLVDHSSDPTSMTAITALPPAGKESCLQSFLGANVAIHVCGRNVFITISSPRGRRGLFQELLVTIHKHDLDIINATISTSTASIFHCLHCQASQDAELLNHDLHSALQRVITNYGPSQF